MNMPSSDIYDLIDDNGSFTWDLFINERPAKEKNCATIYDVNGTDATLLMGDKSSDIYRPNILIQVVGTSKQPTYEKADELRKILHRHDEVVKGEAKYCSIVFRGDVNYIGQLDDQQYIFNINFSIIREEVVS